MAGIGSGAVYGVHNDSLKNLARGVVERVFYVRGEGGLGRPPRPVTGVFNRLHDLRDSLVSCMRPTTVVSRAKYPELYHGRKREIYQKAVLSLAQRGISRKDAIVSTFVKAEKVNFSAKTDPVPRVIQPRTPRYNVEVGRYLKLFECEIVRGFKKMCGYNVILKGLNAVGVAEQIKANWSQFKTPVAIGLDASRFDQHVSVDALRFEHSVYNAVFKSGELEHLLSWQLKNRGIARVENHRVDYEVDGCRMSGDINTGMGNCLLMSLMILGYLEKENITARLSNNGDDCVLFLEERDAARIAGVGGYMRDLGFTMVMEKPVHVLEKVVFCQAQPVETGSGWRMVRDPRTAPSKDAVSLLSWGSETEIRYWCHAIGECGLQLTRGVPFWSEFYSSLVAYGIKLEQAKERVCDSGLGYMARGVQADEEITPAARVSFWRAFGMLPDMQVALEKRFTIDLTQSPLVKFNPSQVNFKYNELSRWAERAAQEN